MRIYNYDPETGEFLSEGAADESPLEPGVYLIPAHATDQPAPTAKVGQAAVYQDGTWRLVPDYRSQSVCLIDADGYYAGPAALALGESPDARHILTDPPAAEIPRPLWSDDKWIDGRTPAETLAAYTAAVQARLDDFARTRGYDGILSACSYASSTNAKFSAEGQYCVSARDKTWAKCYAIMAEVESGKRQMPTLGEIMAELPVLSWPVTKNK
jgi:hypothetical protein